MADCDHVHAAAALPWHRICLELLPAASGRAVPLDQYRDLVGLQPDHLLPRVVGGLGRDQPRQDRTTQAGRRRRPSLRGRLCLGGGRPRGEEPAAFLSGLRRRRGNRHRPRLRHADEHRHEVVPRQEGTDDRHCRHGVWARRLRPQRSACPDPDAPVPPESGPCVRSPGRHPRLGRLRLGCDAEESPGRLSPERLCPVSSEGCPRSQPLCQGRGRVRPAAYGICPGRPVRDHVVHLLSQHHGRYLDRQLPVAALPGYLEARGFGRIVWGAVSERLGRINTFRLLLASQLIVFGILMTEHNPWVFAILVCYVLSCFGGGFAIMPSMVIDVYGQKRMSRVYGVILTAWSAAGILGPMMVARLKDNYPDRAIVYSFLLGILVLGVGFIFSFLVNDDRFIPRRILLQVFAKAPPPDVRPRKASREAAK